MPFSVSSQLSPVLSVVEELRPLSVLDVGVGMGQYGFLIRNNLESLNLFDIRGSVGRLRNRNEWKIRIDGIEGFAGYLTPVHDYAYSKITVGDALTKLREIEDQAYDLVLAIDIIEHFEHRDGVQFVRECQRVCKGNLIVATPEDFLPQEVDANPLENHRSHWTSDELRALGFSRFVAAPESIVAVWNR